MKYYIIERIDSKGTRDYYESSRLDDFFTLNITEGRRFKTQEEAEKYIAAYLSDEYLYTIVTLILIRY